MIVQPVAVEKPRGAACEFEQQVAGVLAGNGRIDPAQPRGDRCHVAQQEAKGVDPVHGCFENQQARHRLEVGLPIEVRRRSLAVARAQAKGDRVRCAKYARIKQALGFAVPRLQPEVLVDYAKHAGAISGVGKCDGLGP